MNPNEERFQDGLIYIKRGDYKKDFTYNSTSETIPMLNIENIAQVKHDDVELGRYCSK